MYPKYRFLLLCCWTALVLGVSADPAGVGAAQPRWALVASGRLELTSDGGRSSYLLRGSEGSPAYRILAARGQNLARFQGQVVQVLGRLEPATGTQTPTILAERISATEKIVPAHYLELADERPRSSSAAGDATAAQEPIPDPRPAPNAGFGDSGLAPIPQDLPPPTLPDLPPLEEGPLIGDPGATVVEAPESLPPPTPLDPYAGPQVADSACGPQHWIWGDLEYLLWFTSGMDVPPLVTTSPAGTPQAQAGVLGEPGTVVLLGGAETFDDWRQGGRLRIGGWLGPRRRVGLQADMFSLEDADVSYLAASNGLDILARPFTNIDPSLGPNQGPDSALTSYLNVMAGTITVDMRNQYDSFGVQLRTNLLCSNGCYYDPAQPFRGRLNGYRLDLLGGYRYARLDDQIMITEVLTATVTPQGGFHVFDQFEAENEFQGGEVGLVGQFYRRRWSLDGLLKMALGRTEQSVLIDGGTQLSTVGLITPLEGGLLALPTNIGSYSRKTTDLVTEFGVTVGYLLTPNLRVTCGYSLVYWPRVVRAGEQIDLTVNGSYIPDPTIVPTGPTSPQFAFHESSFWAQGVNFGVHYRW